VLDRVRGSSPSLDARHGQFDGDGRIARAFFLLVATVVVKLKNVR